LSIDDKTKGSRLLIRRERTVARSISEVPATVSGWPVRVLRPPSGNRMRLSVETGHVRLTWPERVSATTAVSFFEQHQAWLERTVRVYRLADERATADLAFDPRWPGRVPWFGQLLPIHFDNGPARLDIEAHQLRCRVPLDQGIAMRAAQRLLITGLRDALAMRSRVWLREYEPLVGERCQALRIRPMRSLWGSLSPQGAVALNLALAFANEALAEYVLVHELAHFVERTHSTRFWDVVGQLYPDYPQRRRELNHEHRYLQALLRRLFAVPDGEKDQIQADVGHVAPA
jgi:predicted metal-dependent hydrolase